MLIFNDYKAFEQIYDLNLQLVTFECHAAADHMLLRC
jgi:hypothetical protein